MRIIGYRKLFWRFYWKVVKDVPDRPMTPKESEEFRRTFRMEYVKVAKRLGIPE